MLKLNVVFVPIFNECIFASWCKFKRIYLRLCLLRLSGVALEAAELHKAPEQAQAPQGKQHYDLVLLRQKKCLPGSNLQQTEQQVDVPKDVPKVIETKFPKTVWCSVWSPTTSCPRTTLSEVRLKVNTNIYLEVMERTVLPLLSSIAGGRSWVWQQDSVLCLVSNRFMAWPVPFYFCTIYPLWSYILSG